jgi:hypothetical protein
MTQPDSAGWNVLGSGAISCGYTRSGYQVSDNQSSSFLPCQENNIKLDNFTFQVEMVLTGSSGDGGGVVFRNNATSEYRFRMGLNGSYDLIGTGLPGIYGTSSAIKSRIGQTNLVTIIAREPDIYIYINKQRILHTTDTNLSVGIFKLFAVDFTHPTTALFRNVKIWENQGKNW